MRAHILLEHTYKTTHMRAHANTHNMSHGDGEVHDGDDAEVVVQDEDEDDDVEYKRMWRRKTDPNSGSYVCASLRGRNAHRYFTRASSMCRN